ncbi:MAG: ATP-dependent DNA helicase, partial [Thermodesulfobacteriota bacterium]
PMPMVAKEAFRLIAKRFHGFEERPHQIEMADAVEEAVADGSHTVVEAGTGIGKSMAYLVPFIEWAGPGKRVVVSTYTKALQRQLVEKDIPFVIDALGADIRYALCVGGENYLCLRRLNQVRHLGLFEQGEMRGIEELLVWQFTTESGLRSDLPLEPSPRLWQKVRREGDLCLGKRCAYYERCFYQKARRYEKGAQILVTNHHLFFAHIASGGHILPSFDAVVFDEAHELEEVASTYLGLEISNYRLRYLLDAIISPAQRGLLARLGSVREEDLLIIDSVVQQARQAGEEFFSRLSEGFNRSPLRIRKPGFVENTLARPLVQLASLMEELHERVDNDEDALEVKALADRCLLFINELNCIVTHGLDDHVYWAERGDRRVKLVATPLDISSVMQAQVFDAFHPVIMTSATLTTNNSFDFFMERVGLKGCRRLAIDSPFNYEENVLLYLPRGIAEPSWRNNKKPRDYEGDVIGTVKDLLTVTGGRTLLLFTSHHFLGKVHEALKSFHGITTLRQGERDSYTLISGFRETNNSVLLGATTFWQGVDIPGRDLECVVITKLPFQSPDDPVVEARIERLLEEGKEPFNHYQIPNAVLLFRQGFGRLIRRQSDRGVVAILDPRVKTRPYGSRFLNSIPRCRSTESLDDVRDFLSGVAAKVD